MRTQPLALVAVFLLSALPFAFPQASSNSVEYAILGLEKAWNQAELHHDVNAVKAFVAETFVRVDDRGRVQNRTQYLATINDLSYVSEEIVNDDLAVYSYGTTAIAVSRFHVKGRENGKPFLYRGRFIDTWVQINGRWQCVANQETRIR
jgi:ketosteroid isomerase-like protein